MGKVECPFCRLIFPNIVKHLMSKNCGITQKERNMNEVKNQLDSFKEGYRLEISRTRKQKSRAKLREEKEPEIVKSEHNEQNRKSRVILETEKGPEIVKAEQIIIK